MSPSGLQERGLVHRLRRGQRAWEGPGLSGKRLVLALAILAGCDPYSRFEGPERTSFTAITLNLHVDSGAAESTPDAWSHPLVPRRETVIQLVVERSPDVFAVQEGSEVQIDDLVSGLTPRYRFAGANQDPDADDGELVGVFWRNDRFEQVVQGTFWLSEQPDEPGSIFPGATEPHVATWVELEERRTGRFITVLTTQLDSVNQDARELSAGLIVQQLELIAPSPRGRLLLGDLAISESNPAFSTFTNGAALQDSYRVIHPETSPDEATSHGFTGDVEGVRFDHVLPSAGLFLVEDAAIVRDEGPGGYPSDHFPVFAEVSW